LNRLKVNALGRELSKHNIYDKRSLQGIEP